MRHLITSLLLVAAVIAYASGMGPLFFGAPLLGSLLVGAGLAMEMSFWWRVMHPVRR